MITVNALSEVAALMGDPARASMLQLLMDGRAHTASDLAHAARTLTEAGARVLGDGQPRLGAHGLPVLFVHPKDFDGTLIELEEVKPELQPA